MIKVSNLDKTVISNITYEESPSFSGIVAGESKGEMWVDDIDHPQIAIVYSFAVGGFCVLGDIVTNEVCDNLEGFLIEDLFVKLRESGCNYFEFSTESEITTQSLLKMFADKNIESENEYFYRKNNKYHKETRVPDGYVIYKVDTEFVERLEQNFFDNQEFLVERLLESWGTYDDFLDKSVAFFAAYNSRIVAVIVGTAMFQNVIPIDIETEEKHRKKGLAYILTKFFVNECVDNGLVAQWDCVDSNIASKKTAEKCGFELLKIKPYYWFQI